VIFPKRADGSNQYRHLAECPMLGGKYEAKGSLGTLPRPAVSDPQYGEGWSEDPDYEAANSDTEAYR
jgi:hypothetical protein